MFYLKKNLKNKLIKFENNLKNYNSNNFKKKINNRNLKKKAKNEILKRNE